MRLIFWSITRREFGCAGCSRVVGSEGPPCTLYLQREGKVLNDANECSYRVPKNVEEREVQSAT